jgi:UDP:flavonoid glycosyltransferase YjiC (YdhE family)
LAFTDYETEQLRRALLKETRHCAVTLGMKKTSVDQLRKAVLAVCRRLSDTGDMVFIEKDAKLLLQRLPESVKNVHYHDDEAHIRQLLEKYDLVPNRGTSLLPLRAGNDFDRFP